MEGKAGRQHCASPRLGGRLGRDDRKALNSRQKKKTLKADTHRPRSRGVIWTQSAMGFLATWKVKGTVSHRKETEFGRPKGLPRRIQRTFKDGQGKGTLPESSN